MANIDLVKKTYGLNTYTKAVETEFNELLQPVTAIEPVTFTVDDFFDQYEQLFFSIPVSGLINSHTFLVERSQQYIGGSIIDAEKQALIEEINSLRQQLLDINQTFTTINDLI